jgi:hypothetical protein
VLGLQRVAAALRLRVIAVLVGTGLTMLLVVGSASSGDANTSVLKLAMFSGAVIGLASQLWLAIGLMDAASAAVAELLRWPVAV